MVIMFNEEGPEVILVALLDHGDDDDEEKRHEPWLRGDGGVNHPGEDQGHLEGVVSESAPLLIGVLTRK